MYSPEKDLMIRVVRKIEPTVICVDNGQKTVYDKIHKRYIPFSGGATPKSHFMEYFRRVAQQVPAKFIFGIKPGEKEGDKDKESIGYTELQMHLWEVLLRGWFMTHSEEGTIKRTSPLSFNGIWPLHPLLCQTFENKIRTVSRGQYAIKDQFDSVGFVKVENGKITARDEEVEEGSRRPAKLIEGERLMTGLFYTDIVIDLERLFLFPYNKLEKELTSTAIREMRELGFEEYKDEVYGDCLIVPEEGRQMLINALSHAIINWRVYTNQSLHFSTQAVLGVSVSPYANELDFSIMADVDAGFDEEEDKYELSTFSLDTYETNKTKVFITPVIKSILQTNKDTKKLASLTAMKDAEDYIKDYMTNYQYPWIKKQ